MLRSSTASTPPALPQTRPNTNQTTNDAGGAYLHLKKQNEKKRKKTGAGLPASRGNREKYPDHNKAGLSRTRHANHIRHRLGLRPEADQTIEPAPGLLRRTRQWMLDLAQQAWHSLPAWPGFEDPLPGPTAVEGAMVRTVPYDSVLLFDYDYSKSQLGLPEEAARGLTQSLLWALQDHLYPPQNIFTIPMTDESCRYPYIRNLLHPGPGGVILVSGQPTDADARRSECARQAAIRYLHDNGYAYKVLPIFVNWGNVLFQPKYGLLFVANLDSLSHLDVIREALGSPPLVVYCNVDFLDPSKQPTTRYGSPACYDLDQALSLFEQGQDGDARLNGMFNEACFNGDVGLNLGPDRKAQVQKRTMGEMLDHLGVNRIPVGLSDVQSQVINAVYSPHAPDKALMYAPPGKALQRQLKKHGRTPVYGDPRLGHDGRATTPFGPHCMVVQTDDTPIGQPLWLADTDTAVASPPHEQDHLLTTQPIPSPPGPVDEGGVLLLNCRLPPDTVHREAFDAHRYAKAVAGLIGQDTVHVIEGGPCQWPFTAQLAMELPYAMGLLSRPLYSEAERPSMQAIHDFFFERGYPVTPLGDGINPQNLFWSRQHDLLVMADVVPYGELPAGAQEHLIELFARPTHVLHLVLRAAALTARTKDGSREPLCTSLNLVFHVTETQDGGRLAMLHEQCIHTVHWVFADGSRQAAPSAARALQTLEFKVVPLSQQNLLDRVGAAFSSPFAPGHVLLNQVIDDPALEDRLNNEKVVVHVPPPHNELGHAGAPHGVFGVSAMVIHFPPLDTLFTTTVRVPPLDAADPAEPAKSEL